MKTKQIITTLAGFILLFIILLGTAPTVQAQFVHPGGLHTQADFDRMTAKVAAGAHPWIDSYNQLTPIWMANLNMPWHPVMQIIRGGTGNNYARSQQDALAIYYHALRWRITGDTRYADEAIAGCDAWSRTMTNGVTGDSNWALASGICGYEFAVAGEALRGYSGWSQTSISNYCNFLRLFTSGPPNGWGNYNFLGAHQQTCDSHYRCNWDACNIASLMAIGVFCDDTNMFNYAVTYFQQGIGNGNITRAAWYIHNDGTAQWEESGRDQAHTQDGLSWLGVACQVAWNQGVDLYGFDNNRILRGMEYIAKYNLGNNVPYVYYANCDLIATEVGLGGGNRGGFYPTWDMFYNHYVNIKGLAAPYTAQVAAQLRPDGFYNNPNSPDVVGYTTLTCLLDPISAGAVPSGLTANVIAHSANLTWWGSAYATSYNVKRATIHGGPYTTIASVGPNSTYYVDGGLAAGTTNYYVISAVTPSGETANSAEAVGTTANIVGPYYKFDESSGTTASDSSGFGINSTLINGPTWVSGHSGNAVNLNSSSQYVALPAGVIGDLGDFTIATWVNLTSVATSARIFDFGPNTDRYMCLLAHNGYTPQFSITAAGGNTAESIYGTASLGTGWHHVAVTLTGNEGKGVGILYVDGVAVGTNSTMSHTPGMIGDLVNDTNNWIGRSQFSADPYLNGKVDEFRIYNGALNSAGIAAIMAGNPPPTQPGPPAAPSAPTGLSATLVSSSQINLFWMGSTGATSYNVKRSTTSGGPYVIVANIPASLNQTNFNDVGLTDGKTYYYVVTALNDGGESANSSQVSATTPVPVLKDYWKFDETSGTTAFDSASANNGTLAAGSTWSSAGKINGCVSMNGASNSYVSFPAGIVSTLTNFSIASWVYVNTNITWARVFDFGSDTTNYMILVPSSSSGTVHFAITTNSYTAEQTIDSAPGALLAGGWHHLAVTLSGALGSLYIDGVKVAQNGGMTLNPSSMGSTTHNYIGASQWLSPYLNGLVDDFRIYNGALSAAEVYALVYPPPVAPTGLSATAGSSVVNLAWIKSTSPGITTNKVYRSTTGSGGTYNLLTNLAATTSYSDTAVVNGSAYYYSVSAVNSAGESARSSYAGATPQAPTLLNISDSTYPTVCTVSNYQAVGVTGLNGSEIISQFSPAYNTTVTSPMNFTNGGQKIYFSGATVRTWAKNTGPGNTPEGGLLDLYLYNSATNVVTMSVSNLNLTASTTYTLYLIGTVPVSGTNEDGLFTPLNTNPHITYASTTPGHGVFSVQFTTSSSYVNTDTLNFTWARYSASGDGVFDGLAIRR